MIQYKSRNFALYSFQISTMYSGTYMITFVEQEQLLSHLDHLCQISSHDGVTWIFQLSFQMAHIFHLQGKNANKCYWVIFKEF